MSPFDGTRPGVVQSARFASVLEAANSSSAGRERERGVAEVAAHD